MVCNIIITHRGNPPHLKYVLSQIAHTNPDANIILMGDESNKNCRFTKHVFLKDYWNMANDFAQVYTHLNSTSVEYELFCYQRWFCVYEYMKAHNLEDVFSLDSDVLVYDNLNDLLALLKNYPFAVSAKNLDAENPGWWIAGPPIGYFHRDALKRMLDLFIKSYQDKKYLSLFDEKMNWHHSRNEPFGVCDMTQIFFFAQENKNKFFNLSQPFVLNGELSRIDETIMDTTECVADGVRKKLVFENGAVYAFDKNTNKKLRFPLIHFQGYCPINAKDWIKQYYTGTDLKLCRFIEIYFPKWKITKKLINYLSNK